MRSNGKRNKIWLVVRALVAGLLLTSMIVTMLFGTVTAEFVKSFTKSIAFESIADLPWKYYIKDNSHTSGSNFVMADYKTLEIPLVIGNSVNADSTRFDIYIPITETGLYTLDFSVDFAKSGLGEDDDFFVERSTSVDGSTASTSALVAPVGCKVGNHSSSEGDKYKYLTIRDSNRIAYNEVPVFGPNVKYSVDTTLLASLADNFNAYRVDPTNGSSQVTVIDKDGGGGETTLDLSLYNTYQWKTLTPSRMENVSLTFNVDALGTNGAAKYVYWTWDLRGLESGTYTIRLHNISVTKVVAPEENEPYLDFPDSHYVNNAICPDATTYTDTVNPGSKSYPHSTLRLLACDYPLTADGSLIGLIKGRPHQGKTRYSQARGTFITHATYDSMTMRAESLVFGYQDGELVNASYAKENNWANPDRYSNMLVFGVPIKNVEPGKTYKITFDLGLARQGDNSATDVEDYTGYGYAEYASSHQVLISRNSDGGTVHFESYLYTGIEDFDITFSEKSNAQVVRTMTDYGYSQIFSIEGATDSSANGMGRGNFVDPMKGMYNTLGSYSTRYNNIWDVNMGAVGNANWGMVNSVNDYRNISQTIFNNYDAGYNMFNATRYAEYNGQNQINWVTFTNTTFTFTVPENIESDRLENLRWMWAIDSLVPFMWYKIKFDNARIEEVVQYGSNVQDQSLSFSGVSASFETRDEEGLYRGANGTGQNSLARAYAGTIPMANMNIYGPIYDASENQVVINGQQTINLTGYAVCKGGVSHYVWSADNGKTWFNMARQTLTDMSDQSMLDFAESFAENSTLGLKGSNLGEDGTQNNWYSNKCEFADFKISDGDGKNAYYNLTIDLVGTPYQYKPNIDIIIAAVPIANANARCEIMRITEYNSTRDYATRAVEVVSDIELSTGSSNADDKYLRAAFRGADSSSAYKPFTDFTAPQNKANFSYGCGISYDSTMTNRRLEGGYSHRTDKYETSDYSKVRALFTGFPVKDELTVYGFAMVEGGVDGYYWTPDNGLTWYPCGRTASKTKPSGMSDYAYDAPSATATFDMGQQRQMWFDGKTDLNNAALGANTIFNRYNGGLTVDLSAYIGKAIDIIVAVKPKNSNIYCPVARVDNVAVYGENGSFYTQINQVFANGTACTPTLSYANNIKGKYFSGADVWKNLEGIKTFTLAIGGTDKTIEPFMYSAYEPYNIEYTRARLYSSSAVSIAAGSDLVIRGFMALSNPESGTYKVKYEFDNGTAQTDDISVSWGTNSVVTNRSLKTDNSLSKTFVFNNDYQKNGPTTTNITITVPSDLKSKETNLLVYLESPSGAKYPILNIRLNVT